MKRILLYLIVMCMPLACAYAQQFTIGKSVATMWVESTVDSAFFLSRQSFQVCDKKTGELYGLNNQNEFGTQFSLGVKVKNGYVLTDKAIRPWVYDSKFETYKNGYDPVTYASMYSEFAGETNFDSLDISKSKVNELLTSKVYFVASNSLLNRGLSIDNADGTKKGWIVWVCTDKDGDLNKTAKLELVCLNMTVEASNEYDTEITAPNGFKTLGGIYVTPKNEGIGLLEFYLSGILIENDGKWSLRFPFIGKERITNIVEDKREEKKAKVEEKDTLTPVADDVYGSQPSKRKKSDKKK